MQNSRRAIFVPYRYLITDRAGDNMPNGTEWFYETVWIMSGCECDLGKSLTHFGNRTWESAIGNNIFQFFFFFFLLLFSALHQELGRKKARERKGI